jgi:YegS C-terminal NAD kinase beta sandwich-like domain
MTIRKGEAWGEPGPLPPDGVLARTDREVRAVAEGALVNHGRPPAVGLLGGDLCRTVGGRGDEVRLRSDAAVRLPVDLGHVWLDEREAWFAAHLVARRWWWWGRLFAVVNAQYLGAWDLAPTGHPNDGRLDVVDVSPSMSLRDRLRARSRLPLGTHVPHPAITTRRVTSLDERFDPPLKVWLDGVPEGEVHHLVVKALPDALTVVV